MVERFVRKIEALEEEKAVLVDRIIKVDTKIEAYREVIAELAEEENTEAKAEETATVGYMV